MKHNVLIILSFFLLNGPIRAAAHPSESRVAIEAEVSQIMAGEVEYVFELIDLKKKQVVTDAELAIQHEKKLHFVAYDAGLSEFQHVHPEFKEGKWRVGLKFQKSGSYWVWAQGLIEEGKVEFAASETLSVKGGEPANDTPPVLPDMRSGSDGVSAIALSGEVLHARKIAMLSLVFSRSDGSQPELSPYLGAAAHVTAVPSDGDSFVHVHPVSTPNPNKLLIHAKFPFAGSYRIWIEFIDGGVLRRVPLAVEVLE